jgi:ribosomal protein S18 acetylase RimI-like enzyme
VGTGGECDVRSAGSDDAGAIGRLLHDFNCEFDEPTPTPDWLGGRIRTLLEQQELTVLLAGAGPDGLVALRFRPAIWTERLECYVAELYVVPDRRGNGLGRALMEGALALARARGADHIDLNTADSDLAARALYESLGFDRHESGPDGPLAYYYWRSL